MTLPDTLIDFWQRFTQAVGGADESRFYEAFHFGDSEAQADELADLTLRGIKRATASAVWTYEAEGKAMPRPGDLSIVTDGSGAPLCVIETRSVAIVPFEEVTAAFAAAEGEGDGSLAFWQDGHRRYFSRECAAAGRVFSERMPVACEHFELVYRP